MNLFQLTLSCTFIKLKVLKCYYSFDNLKKKVEFFTNLLSITYNVMR